MGKFMNKDFLLGIGAGFILSAIFVLFVGLPQISDEQIIGRAKKLGMVDQQQISRALTESGTSASGKSTAAVKPDKASTVVKDTASSKPPAVNSVTITVTTGMGSEEIAKMLVKKGAIRDQTEFLRTVTKLNAHTRFQNGTFVIPAGEQPEKIVTLLTVKR